MRTLIIQSIVHTPADMGSMKDALKEKGIEKLGKKAWLENQKKIEKFWNEVEKAIDKFNLNFSNVRIYQDGMPCDGELAIKIINEAAKTGSRNYQIIKKLIEKGAKIEMTESRDLLLKEYDNIKEFVNAESKEKKTQAIKKYEEAKDKLIEERDNFIAKRIDETLKEDETGFLFIGAHHNIKSLIPKDIQIKDFD